jgi:hypothetical protein
MMRGNKAHATTVNRIVRRYSGKLGLELRVDVEVPEGIIEVETEATISRGIRHLKKFRGPVYLAVTNREALPEALRATTGSRIGVMDPQGNIVKPSQTKAGGRNGASAGQGNGARKRTGQNGL